MKPFSIELLIVVFLFSNCSGSSSEKAATTSGQSGAIVYDNSLTKGKVIDSIVCKNQNNHNYALYLPSYYSSDKKFPAIYFFDSHARGGLPLRKYKELAEKYGFVLIGSNISKNGTPWQVTNEGVKALMEDTHDRISIDPKQVYTCGFSGGSRVASSVAIIDGGVAGVIGCAVGFPSVEHPFENKFDYFGIVGDYDFNITDMKMLDEALGQNGFVHQLLTFSGKHEWPPVQDFETGMLWLEVNAMKENLQPKNDTLIMALKSDYDKRIVTAKTTDDLIKEHELLDGAEKVFNGLSDVSRYKEQIAYLEANAKFKTTVAADAQLQQAELTLQQELAKAFAVEDEQWWAKKISALNHEVRSAKTKKESQMNQRLLNYLGLIGYLNSNHAINTGDLANAIAYLKIFKMADPENSDCSYLTAVYYIKSGKPQQALSALNEAASLGFSDISQVAFNPLFSGLQDDAGFKNMINKVRANSAQ